ncbi:MAG: YraN family protein [Caulobacteraceae bacterium]
MGKNKLLGAYGEDTACKYLENSGYRVLERNFSCRTGEIDIIAAQGDTIVFIEVKTRTSDRFGMPSEAVSTSKQQKLVKTALFYMQSRKLFDYMSRFDVLEVFVDEDLGSRVNLIKDAFQYSGRYGY